MSWPEPPHPMDGITTAVMVAAFTIVLLWVLSPVFNACMGALH